MFYDRDEHDVPRAVGAARERSDPHRGPALQRTSHGEGVRAAHVRTGHAADGGNSMRVADSATATAARRSGGARARHALPAGFSSFRASASSLRISFDTVGNFKSSFSIASTMTLTTASRVNHF